MKEKNVKKNYIYNMAYQMLVIITPLLTAPYIARVLGADNIGIFSYVTAIAAFFIIFANLGTTTYGQREVSYVQFDKHKRSVVFFNTLIFRWIATLIFVVIFGICIAIFCPKYLIIYIIQIVEILNVGCDTSWFFQGLEEFGLIVGRNAIFRIINLIMVFTMIKGPDDLALYTAMTAFITMAGHISLWFYLPKYIEKVNIKELTPFKDIKVILALFIPTIAVQIYQYLDKIMIHLFAGANSEAENGYYEQAMRITRMVLVLVTSLSTVMVPRIGRYFSEGNKEKINSAMYKAYRFAWFLSLPLMFGLLGIADSFIPWFYGVGYEKVNVLLKIVSVITVAISINNITGIQYLVPTKREKLYTNTIIIGCIANIVLNYILIPRYASYGAAIASVVAETLIAGVQLFAIRKELSVGKVFAPIYKYLIAGVLMYGVLFIEGKFMPAKILTTFTMIATGAIVYMGCLVVMRDEFFTQNARSILDKVKSRFKK